MSNSTNRTRKLKLLRSSIPELRNLGPTSEEFRIWHEELLNITKEIFGNDSPELSDVRALRFEISSDIIEGFKHQITDPNQPEEIMKHRIQSDPHLLEALRRVGDDPGDLLDSSRKSHYNKALDKAGELISTMIFSVKNN